MPAKRRSQGTIDSSAQRKKLAKSKTRTLQTTAAEQSTKHVFISAAWEMIYKFSLSPAQARTMLVEASKEFEDDSSIVRLLEEARSTQTNGSESTIE